MKTLHVVCAMILENSRVLVTKRGYGTQKGGWEFPGGKIEAQETPQNALIREIREELSTEIEIRDELMTIEYDYPDFHLSMICFTAGIRLGHPVLREHEDARWVSSEELDGVDFLPADRMAVPVLQAYMEHAGTEKTRNVLRDLT